MARLLHDLLLQAGKFGVIPSRRPRSPRATITASLALHHLGQILDGLGALDFRDQQRLAAGRAQQIARFIHVRGIAREGNRQIIDLERGGDADVFAVLIGQGAGRQSAALAVDALVVAEFAAHQTRVLMRGPSMDDTCRLIWPSFSNSTSPTDTSEGSFLYAMPTATDVAGIDAEGRVERELRAVVAPRRDRRAQSLYCARLPRPAARRYTLRKGG